jgi:serine/threonine-protein kinase
LIENVALLGGLSLTPDGRRLAFAKLSQPTGFDIWTAPLERESAGLRAGNPEVFLRTPSHELNPAFSPDGRWLAYASDATGSFQVFVRAFPDKGGVWQVSSTSGFNPVWSRNGRQLFFRTLDGQVMVAAYTVNGDAFIAEKPRVWSEKRIATLGILKYYDVSPDGKRIVALMPMEGPEGERSQNHVTLLLNFYDELRRRVPTGVR